MYARMESKQLLQATFLRILRLRLEKNKGEIHFSQWLLLHSLNYGDLARSFWPEVQPQVVIISVDVFSGPFDDCQVFSQRFSRYRVSCCFFLLPTHRLLVSSQASQQILRERLDSPNDGLDIFRLQKILLRKGIM